MQKSMYLMCLLWFSLALSGCGSGFASEVVETVAAQEVVVPPRPMPTPTPRPTPRPIPRPTPTPTPTPEPIIMPEIHSVMEFAGLKWRVLGTDDYYVLVISEYVLGQRWFHHTANDLSWAGSGIRAYLNGEFLENFSDAELSKIVRTEISTDPNPWFGTPGGEDTPDLVFLLSLEEVARYFGDSGQLADRAHPGNINDSIHDEYNPVRIAANLETKYDSWWWLRSPGLTGRVTFVGICGRMGVDGTTPTNQNGGIRPAMWINYYLLYEYNT